ncbi:MAG: GNAT family N-acetyltransferase [Vulcanimicrobiaceae bacterium]
METARLCLRVPRAGDEGLCARMLTEAQSTRPEPLPERLANSFGTFMVEHWRRYGFGFFILDVKDESLPEPAGHLGFKYIGADPLHWPQSYEAIELGYALVPKARGRGYATEAGRAALAAAFAAFDVPSIRGRCGLDNAASAAVLLRCGMTELPSDDKRRRFEIWRPAYGAPQGQGRKD